MHLYDCFKYVYTVIFRITFFLFLYAGHTSLLATSDLQVQFLYVNK